MKVGLVASFLSLAVVELHATCSTEEALSPTSKSDSLGPFEVFHCSLSLLKTVDKASFRRADHNADIIFAACVDELKHADKESQILDAWSQKHKTGLIVVCEVVIVELLPDLRERKDLGSVMW